MNVIWEILQPFIGELVVTLVVLGGLLGLWKKGKNDQRRDDELRRAKSERETRGRMDSADASMGDDPDVLRDRLRERGRRSGDL